MWQVLASRATFEGVDTASLHQAKIPYHLQRVQRHCRALLTLMHPPRGTHRSVYFTCPGGSALWYLVLLAPVARLCRYDITVHHHSYSYINRRSVAMRLLVHIGGRRCLHVLLSPSMLRRFGRTYGPVGQLKVCSNAAWLPTSSVSPRRKPSSFTIGLLSRLTDDKGIGAVLATLRLLLKDGVDARLRLAGPPGASADQRLIDAARQEFGDRLDLVGVVLGPGKDAFLSSLDAFVFPTRYEHEAEPLVVLEALASGTPVVAYGRGCIAEMVSEAEGLVVDPAADFAAAANPYLLALALGRVPSEAARRGARAGYERRLATALEEKEQLLARMVGPPP